MKTLHSLSKHTLRRWWLNALMLLVIIGLTFSSLYFLVYSGGFQGGRNPYYNKVVLFNRPTWDSIHLWTGLAIIITLIIHILWHRDWFTNMFKRCKNLLTCRVGYKNVTAWLNIFVNGMAAIAFIVAAVSGVLLFFIPGGRGTSEMVYFYLTKDAWKIMHNWSGSVMLLLVFVHYIIHWGWVRKVTRRILFPAKRITSPVVSVYE